MAEHQSHSEELPIVDFVDERLQMSHWYPKLSSLDVPTPNTYSVPVEKREGEPPKWDSNAVQNAVESLGGEAFVRSDYKSASLGLDEGSHIGTNSTEAIDQCLKELVAQHSMMQLPLGQRFWLREWLSLNWDHYAPETLHPEIRVFIENGEVLCHHPRLQGFGRVESGDRRRSYAEDYIDQSWTNELEEYAERVANEFTGSWSVDFVYTTDRDWYCTDMALRALTDRGGELHSLSEHNPSCEHNLENIYGISSASSSSSEGEDSTGQEGLFENWDIE
jgi:hypothetical protein